MHGVSPPEHLFKVLLVGEMNAGKSSILARYMGEPFTDVYIATIGVDFKVRDIQIDHVSVRMQIWDTAGQERFQSLTQAYYRGANGVFLVFDGLEADTFRRKYQEWMNTIRAGCGADANVMLLINKCDMIDGKADAIRACDLDALGVPYMFTSARTNENVDDAFNQMAHLILARRAARISGPPARDTRALHSRPLKLDTYNEYQEEENPTQESRCGC